MSKASLALATLYALASLWLAWFTVNTFGYAPAWASVLNAAASIVYVIAIVSEADHTDVQRGLRVQLERATRPTLTEPADAPPVDDARLTLAEEQAFADIEAHYRKDAA